MSESRRPPQGWAEYLRFFRSSRKLVLEIAALVACLLGGIIFGLDTNSPEAGLIGGSLLILGVVLLIDVLVKVYEWDRARPR